MSPLSSGLLRRWDVDMTHLLRKRGPLPVFERKKGRVPPSDYDGGDQCPIFPEGKKRVGKGTGGTGTMYPRARKTPSIHVG